MMIPIGTLGNALLVEQFNIWSLAHHWRMNGCIALIAGKDYVRRKRMSGREEVMCGNDALNQLGGL